MWVNRTSSVVVILLAVVFDMVACQSESSVLEPAVEGDAILAAMEATLQDEFRAELIYQGVLDNFGLVRPFSNIINAEVRHSESIGRLFSARGLPVPESQWTMSEIPVFQSLTEACRAGVQAEIDNAEIYDRYFALSPPADVRTVFESNRAASLNNHLPAFQRCS